MDDKKRLKEMEEEVQILLMKSNGIHTKEVKDLCERIDNLNEFIGNSGGVSKND